MRDSLLVGAGLFAAFTLLAHADPAPGALGAAVTAEDGWSRWRVAALPERATCCFGDWRGTRTPTQGCTLAAEGLVQTNFGSFDDGRGIAPSDAAVVYARSQGGAVTEVFAVSATCPVDARVTVRDLEAAAGASIALLEAHARGSARRDASKAHHALALHADAGATAALARLASGDADRRVREDAVFWLGHARGADGLAAAARIARTDADDDLRSRALFAMSQSREASRLDAIAEVLRAERDGEVRREGYFAVSQTRHPGARAVLERALAAELDEDALRGAVFGLSQLPDGAGTDALLAMVKRSDLAPRQRREALFWLSQSRDPRAAAALEDILSR